MEWTVIVKVQPEGAPAAAPKLYVLGLAPHHHALPVTLAVSVAIIGVLSAYNAYRAASAGDRPRMLLNLGLVVNVIGMMVVGFSAYRWGRLIPVVPGHAHEVTVPLGLGWACCLVWFTLFLLGNALVIVGAVLLMRRRLRL
ncbi:MAG: hypothetical protein ABGY09_07925 [Euryarchaeota archaeon]